jgi:hypothetical protein
VIRREVGRAVVQSVMAAASPELRERLTATLVGDPSTKDKMVTELDESARRIESVVAAALPVIH